MKAVRARSDERIDEVARVAPPFALGVAFGVGQFVENFEVLAAAPNGVTHLRDMILELAVQGRLVPQAQGEQSASDLISKASKAMSAGRQRRTVEGLPPEPHAVPSGWVWCQPQDLGVIAPRNQAPDEAEVGFVPMPVVPTDYRQSVRPAVRRWGEIKTGYTHIADGDIAVAKITPCFQNKKSCVMRGLRGRIGGGTTELLVLRLVPSVADPNYLLLFFKSPGFISGGVERMTGTAGQQRVPVDYFAAVPLPLPPLAEQKRIVAKVDELMRLLDDLEAKQTREAGTQTRLRSAALSALMSAVVPKQVAAAGQRVAENFVVLFCKADSVGALRGAVLSSALRGVLCPNATNMDALREVRGRKPQLRELSEDERPYSVPSKWTWLWLADLLGSLTDGDHLPPPKAASGTPFLTIGNVSSGTLDFSQTRFVSSDYIAKLDPRRLPAKGDILYTVVGATYGRPVKVDDDRPFCVQRHIAILRPDGSCDRDYLYLFLRSPLAYAQATSAITGTAQPTVPLRPLRRFKVPVPPIEEQRRIVAKVQHLMGLCDELEEKLRRAEGTAGKLVEAVVTEIVAV